MFERSQRFSENSKTQSESSTTRFLRFGLASDGSVQGGLRGSHRAVVFAMRNLSSNTRDGAPRPKSAGRASLLWKGRYFGQIKASEC